MILNRIRNGIDFVIDYPADELIKEIESKRVDWIDNLCDVIHSNERATEEKINKEIDDMIAAIKYSSEDLKGIRGLVNSLPLKKNNKLSKSSKPTIHQLGVGYYIDKCYGWRTYEIRVVIIDELHAKVIMQDTIVHY